MNIKILIAEISRKIGELEVIQYSRELNSTIKSRDLLSGAYVLDEFIEFRGVTGMEISLEKDRFLRI